MMSGFPDRLLRLENRVDELQIRVAAQNRVRYNHWLWRWSRRRRWWRRREREVDEAKKIEDVEHFFLLNYFLQRYRSEESNLALHTYQVCSP